MTRPENKDRGLFLRAGKWWIRYSDENGREHRECVGAKSLAQKVYNKRKAQIAERRFFPEALRRRDVLAKEYLREFAETRRNRRSAKDIARYAREWGDVFGGKTMRQITVADIERALAPWLGKVSAQTVRHRVSFLRRAFKRAVLDGVVDMDAAAHVRPPRASSGRVRFLSVAEETELRKHMKPHQWLVVEFAMQTGLRQEEQFTLRRKNLDLRNGLINVPKTKTGRARAVPMTDRARTILRELPRQLKAPWVFTNPMGGRLNAHNFYERVFRPAVVATGIEDVTWHTLRHTFASRLAMSGVDLPTIGAYLGHASPTMTARYAHLSPGHLTRSIRALDTFSDEKRTGTRTGTGVKGQGGDDA